MTLVKEPQIAMIIKHWNDCDGNEDIEVIPMTSYDKARERLKAEALGEINFWNDELDYHIKEELLDGETHYIDVDNGAEKNHRSGNLEVVLYQDSFMLYDDRDYRRAEFWIEVRPIEG